MPSTYTPRTRIEKIATGEQGGSWGDTTNNNLERIDIAINGIATETISASNTTSGGAASLALGTSTVDENGRHQMIIVTDAGDIGGAGYVKLGENTSEKICIIRNDLSASRNLFVFQGTYNASNDVSIPNGKDVLVKFDGGGSSAVVEMALKDVYFESVETSGNVTVGGNISVTGDLTIADDGLKAATNTSGHILVNDGTNFNPVAVSGDVTISSAGAVTVANDAITNDMVADNAVDTAQIAADSVTQAKIAALAVGTTEIAADAVTNAKIALNAVDTDEIAASAVETAKINDLAVTTAKIAADAVTNAKIGALAVDTAELAASAVETAKINDGAVTTAKLAATSVTQAKLATNVNVRSVDTAGDASGWVIKADGTNLLFQYNGVTKFKVESDGHALSADDITAFATL